MIGEEVGRGVRSAVYRFGAHDAAKIPHPGVPSDWLAEELRLTDLAAAAGAPTPGRRRLATVDGRWALVQSYVAGPTMADELAAQPGCAVELGVELAGVQAALAALAPSIALPAQRDRLVSKVHTAARRHGDDLLRALELLPNDDQPLVLCHGDLHPGNVIRSSEGDVLVDWFDASRGTIAGEIARTTIMLRAGPRAHDGRLGAAFDVLADSYRGAAGQRSGVSDDVLGDWETVQLVARLAEGFGASDLPELRRRLIERTSR